jgi:hypothetical protein
LGAKAAVCVNPASVPFDIDNHIEAMLPTAEAVAFRGWNINVIHARTKHHAPSLTGQIVAFANRDFGFAFTIPVKKKPHSPTSNPLSLDERIGGYIEILNSDSISTPAFVPAAITFRAACGCGSGDEHCPQCSP